jgi:hypothetical protein
MNNTPYFGLKQIISSKIQFLIKKTCNIKAHPVVSLEKNE